MFNDVSNKVPVRSLVLVYLYPIQLQPITALEMS